MKRILKIQNKKQKEKIIHMRDEISEQSKMYASKTITAEEVYKMCDNDIALEHIDNFIGDKVLVLTDDLYIFICANKDLTDRGVNVILEDSLKLFMAASLRAGLNPVQLR